MSIRNKSSRRVPHTHGVYREEIVTKYEVRSYHVTYEVATAAIRGNEKTKAAPRAKETGAVRHYTATKASALGGTMAVQTGTKYGTSMPKLKAYKPPTRAGHVDHICLARASTTRRRCTNQKLGTSRWCAHHFNKWHGHQAPNW